MCIRCRKAEASHPLGYCGTCALHVRLEVLYGLKRLGQYLASWAAFEDWLAERRLTGN